MMIQLTRDDIDNFNSGNIIAYYYDIGDHMIDKTKGIVKFIEYMYNKFKYYDLIKKISEYMMTYKLY